jgi:sugar phosphate isomerase/epimerase
VHPRISLHQVAFVEQSTAAFLAHCRTIGVAHASLVSTLLARPRDSDAARTELANGGIDVTTINHPFGQCPDLERDRGEAAQQLLEALAVAASLGATTMYLLTGGRGSLSWEQAAQRFAELIEPAKKAAADAGITLLVENASPFNTDIHIAHTLSDALRLAEIAGVGLCVDLHACWTEAGLTELFERAMPHLGLVQVSDYVLGDRAAPCRAVPGDGVIPLDRLIGGLLAAGYTGLFDLELVGPRIATEGAPDATRRAADRLSTMLTELGA